MADQDKNSPEQTSDAVIKKEIDKGARQQPVPPHAPTPAPDEAQD